MKAGKGRFSNANSYVLKKPLKREPYTNIVLTLMIG
jgi:hypothetical protein